VVVRFSGRDWELHTGLPASVMLDVIEAKAKGDEEISDEQAIGMLRQLVPAPVLEAWFAAGLTIDELLELVPMLMRAYAGSGDEEAPEGEAPAPGAAPMTSSATVGGSLKPISSASTDSTSEERSKTA
jgi:hypothetical protein